MRFSVIIPTFNSQDYIIQTLLSVKEQDFSDFEVIVIDDGSFDDTVSIIKDFSDNHHFEIKVIEQKNSGPNVARNKGMEVASGDYFIFLDSDDLLSGMALSEISHQINLNEFDIIVYGVEFFDNVTNKKLKTISHSNEIIEKDKIIYNSFVRNKFSNICWNKCVSSKLIKTNNIKFIEDKVHGRDAFFCKDCLLLSSKVMLISNILVSSRCHNDSFSRSFSYKNIESGITVANDLFDRYNNVIPTRELNKAILDYLRYIHITSAFRLDFESYKKATKDILFLRSKFENDKYDNINIVYKLFSMTTSLSWVFCFILSKFNIRPY